MKENSVSGIEAAESQIDSKMQEPPGHPDWHPSPYLSVGHHPSLTVTW